MQITRPYYRTRLATVLYLSKASQEEPRVLPQLLEDLIEIEHEGHTHATVVTTWEIDSEFLMRLKEVMNLKLEVLTMCGKCKQCECLVIEKVVMISKCGKQTEVSFLDLSEHTQDKLYEALLSAEAIKEVADKCNKPVVNIEGTGESDKVYNGSAQE